jgi:Radical SAM superfamily/Iron-sulfur cluster-binding domain
MMLRAARASLAYRLGRTKLAYPPLLVSLEPTNFCNLRCPMCPVGHHAKDPAVSRGFMSDETFERLLPQLAAFKPVIAFHMGGETLMHRRFAPMGRRLRDAGMTVRLDSNAMLLGTEAVERLIEEQPVDELYLDMDGEDAASYEELRKRAKFDRFVANVRHLLAERARRGSKLKVIIKGIRRYEPGKRPGFPPHYKALFADNPPDAYRFAWADYWPGSHRSEVAAADGEVGVGYAVEPANFPPSRCQLLWSRLAIGWDGKGLLCCLDLNRTSFIGDLREEPLLDVWNGAAMRAARRAHVEGRQHEMELCGTCMQIRRQPPRLSLFANRISSGRDAAQGGERVS